MRNVTKQSAMGHKIIKKYQRYDLTVGELCQLINPHLTEEQGIALYNAVCDAFFFGVCVGQRIGVK